MPSNLESARKAYDLFQRGDIPRVIRDVVDDKCQWIYPGPKAKLPWAGKFKGKLEVGNFFAQLIAHCEFTEFTPLCMIESGDTVVTIGRSSARIKATGKTVHNDWVHIGRYDAQGKLIFFQAYADTAAEVSAMS